MIDLDNTFLASSLLTLKDYDVSGKTVLVRVDLNVPMQDGMIRDNSRLLAVKKTLCHLIQHKAKVVVISHFGRPHPEEDPAKWERQYSLAPLVPALSSVLGYPVQFINHYTGPLVAQAVDSLPPDTLLLLENIRYAPGEETNSQDLAYKLAQGMDFYVNEAFSCCHRAHASIEAITHYLPSLAGFHLATEVSYLEHCLSRPQKPFVAIVGGAKVSTKLTLLENLCKKVDFLVIGGAMANTFLVAQGYKIGSSLWEPGLVSTAQKILQTASATLVLPQDVIVAPSLDDVHASFSDIQDIKSDQKIFDMGPKSLEHIKTLLQTAKTVVWNGPVGAFEYPPFQQGTYRIATILAHCTAQGTLTVAGGGDTLAALAAVGAKDQLSYVSTAGGAFLEWLEGKELPGIQALCLKQKRV